MRSPISRSPALDVVTGGPVADNASMPRLPIAAISAGFVALLGLAGAGRLWSQADGEPPFHKTAEFRFLRLEYEDRRGTFRGFGHRWWRQDWPEADAHFSQGIRRLTRIDVGQGHHLPLTDDRIFDYPWAYATQVAYWDLTDPEIKRLRDYLDRGGFLVVDDFHGPSEWEAFRQTMVRLYPDRPILDIEDSDPMMHVLYDIQERTTIPGLRHLRRGPGGAIHVQPQAIPPCWRAISDAKGRMVVAINYNMDIGDAWEHADLPEYPAEMTMLAYRFGINYILYAMTH